MAKFIHISFTGPTIRLLVNSRDETFEMHGYMGPVKLRADGEPSQRFWSEKSPFWPIFQKWFDQGQNVNEHGIGVIK